MSVHNVGTREHGKHQQNHCGKDENKLMAHHRSQTNSSSQSERSSQNKVAPHPECHFFPAAPSNFAFMLVSLSCPPSHSASRLFRDEPSLLSRHFPLKLYPPNTPPFQTTLLWLMFQISKLQSTSSVITSTRSSICLSPLLEVPC